MAEHPKTGSEPRPAFELENCQDYTSALGMIAAARRLFLVLLVFSLMLQVGVYATARWSPAWLAIEPAASPATDSTASADDVAVGDEFASLDDADTPVADVADVPQADDPVVAAGPIVSPSTVRRIVEGVMPVMAFAGVISCIMLMLCYIVALNLALSGRLGGVRGSLAGFLWMAVALILLLPWEQWLGPLGSPLSGVYSTAAQTMDIPTDFATGMAEAAHYVRYLAYPVLALLIVWVADRRYARGYRMACRQADAWLHVRRL